MPSVIESPSGRVPEKAPRWDLMGTEACGGEKVFWWMLLVLWEYLGIYRPRIRIRGASWGPQARPPLGHALEACGLLGTLLTSTPSPTCVFWSKKNHRESFILFGLRLIFLFCKSQKQGKNRNWHWALG
jgi:hypothetical protein